MMSNVGKYYKLASGTYLIIGTLSSGELLLLYPVLLHGTFATPPHPIMIVDTHD